MMRYLFSRRAQSVLEYIILLSFILGAFFVFQKYIVRGVSGHWKGVGDAFGQGRLYDPHKTIECAYDYHYHNVWYNAVCYDEKCDCQTVQQSNATCSDCILGCRTIYCD